MRQKLVHTTDMVAHLWANQSQEYARNSRHNLYFDRDTIYSYGSHFPIARHVTQKNGKGKSAVLLTTKGYSHTTNGHKWVVERACSNLTIFHVSDVTSDARKQFADYQERYRDLVSKYSKARQKKPYYLEALRQLVEEANSFASFFGLRQRLTLPNDLFAMVAECKAMEKRERERRQREAKRRVQEAQKLVDRWLSGENVTLGWTYQGPIRLRIVDSELQTSKGARVPLSHAIKAYRILKRLRSSGDTYQRNGHTIHLGEFALDSLDTEGNVIAGCHSVGWDEIERIATLAGVK